MEITGKEKYAQQWSGESEYLSNHGIYEQLAYSTPPGNILEFGCGSGRGTHQLLRDHAVLSLESNEYLIDETKRFLASEGLQPIIHKCDFFTLSNDDLDIIYKFKPKVLVEWFIGSDDEEIYQHTSEISFPPRPGTFLPSKKITSYREKIEDIIVSPIVCLPSVQHIHLVSRGYLSRGVSEKLIFNEIKEDYDYHVFKNVGFEVISIENIPWPNKNNGIQHRNKNNVNLISDRCIPVITSITAKRIN